MGCPKYIGLLRSRMKEMEKIQQCLVCKEWFNDAVLEKIFVPDQAGYVYKSVCKKCLQEIEERSK